MKTRKAAVLLFCAIVSSASMARADAEYTDDDSAYLKVTSFFLEPVGTLLEWVVFRPIHRVHHWIDPNDPYEPGQVYSAKSVCTGLRPRSECGLMH